MEVEELLEKLDGSRVRVVYDSPYAIRSFIFGHLMDESCCCVVYSDTMMRRLERTYSSLRRAGYPELNVRSSASGAESTRSAGWRGEYRPKNRRNTYWRRC